MTDKNTVAATSVDMEAVYKEELKRRMREATRRRQDTAETLRHVQSVVFDAQIVERRLKEEYAIAEREETRSLEALEAFNAERNAAQTGA